jgi:hypothetical protein
MGGGAALSWTDELRPLTLSPWRLSQDLLECWRAYCKDEMARSQAIAFLGLRVAQRASYWAGWTTGELSRLKKSLLGG